MRPPPRLAELVLVLALVAGGTWLRWIHLGTPSLWWDEIVHARIATQPTVPAVWRTARTGAAPGMGNAGAVPLDYLVLHAWLAWTPAPAPEAIERHYRMPAFAFAVVAMPIAWVVGRALGGTVAGTLALGLLATSVPHVLYAAEARFYSLYVLAALANLAAFTALVAAPSARRFAVFTVVAVAYVLSGLYGVFPVAAEYLVLAGLAGGAGGAGRDRPLVAAAIASALVVAGTLALWIAPSAVTGSYGRGDPAALDVRSAAESTLLFFAGSVPWLAAAFGASLVLAPVVLRRDRVGRAVALVFVLSAGALSVMVAIAHAKQYYFHPRHALFLLPMVHLATACVLGAAISRLVRWPDAAALAGATIGVALSATTIVAYVRAPLPYFQATKTLRDFRGLVRTLARRTDGQPPGARWVLLVSKGRPGHLANPTLAFYLDAYGLAERVMLGALSDPAAALGKLPAACPTGCRGPTSVDALVPLGIADPFDQTPLMRQLMQLRQSTWTPDWTGLTAIIWSPSPPLPTPPGLIETHLDGLTMYDVRAGAGR